MAKKPETPSNAKATAPGRLPFDQVVEVEGAIAGTRDTPLPLKMSAGPQPGGRLSLQGVGTGETPLPLKASPDGSTQHVTTAAFDVSFDQAAFLDQPSITGGVCGEILRDYFFRPNHFGVGGQVTGSCERALGGMCFELANELKLGLLEAVKKIAVGFGRSAPRRRRMFSLFAEWGKTD